MTPPGPDAVVAALADVVPAIASIVGFGALAAVVVGTAAFAYRWYAREPIPPGLAVLFGMGTVAFWLNTKATLSQFIGGTLPEFGIDQAIVTIATFGSAAVAAGLAARVADRTAVQTAALAGSRSIEGELGTLVRTVGRVIAVELPATIEDIDGYEPVDAAVKEELSDRTLVFPRGLTVAAFRERLVVRLKEDYGVGHVDVDLREDGTVAYLALGSRTAGIGPTLAPGTVAVAVRADPAHSASPGDAVQVWRPGPERILTGELRATVDNVATLAVDADDATRLSPTESYRLVTLPASRRPDREFASLLRTADETVATIAVADGGPLVDATVGSLGVTVAAIESADGTVEALPSRNRRLAPGETLYVIARPDAIRKVEGTVEG